MIVQYNCLTIWQKVKLESFIISYKKINSRQKKIKLKERKL